jgi:hypothetical protein
MIKTLLYIKEFFNNILLSIGSLLKVLLISRPAKQLPLSSHDDLIILGNGPSLKSFLTHHSDFIKNKDLLAVNHFVNTEEYEKWMPSLYLINVPEFWKEDVEEDYKEKRIKIFEDFARKTTWDIHLFLDAGAKKAQYWKTIIQKNPHIKIHYFNPTPIEGFRKFRYFCYDHQCGMPRPHNVLIPSIMTGIHMKYNNIFLVGADHNWMQELFVDDDNTVYLTQKHFYDAQVAKPAVMKKEGKGKRKMHEILTKFMYAFKAYWELNEYAIKKKVQIINITPGSMIDAFKRMNL